MRKYNGMRGDYSKHKDRDPNQTVQHIQCILDSVGLSTSLVWTSHQFGGTHSNRVSIDGTSLGTNGKGTTEEYATASGYAELMERLQNKMVGQRTHVPETYVRHGFYDFPDERLVASEDIASRCDDVIDGWLDGWGMHNDEERLQFLKEVSSTFYRRDDGMLAEVPFADVFAGEVRWFSPGLYRGLYGSNGMSAGNTMEECLVQGLSEVFERYVKLKILRGEAVPPRIPHEVLAAWSVGDLIERIEQSGRYRVYVYDGSLGKGYPVAVTAIVDRFRGTFGVDCGAHPSLAVAVERTITEAFQGRDVDSFTGINDIASQTKVVEPDNLMTMIVSGEGVYPASFLVGEPSWEFVAWPSDEGLTNAELLGRMVELLRRDGYTLLVRNASFLGFPTCHIVVPGMSETHGNTPEEYARARSKWALRAAISHFPQVTPEQQECILSFERENIDNVRLIGFDRPFMGGKMFGPRLFGFLHLAREEFGAAKVCFLKHEKVMQLPASLYWQAMARYAGWREEGLSHEEALGLIERLYIPTVWRRVGRDTEPGPGMLERQFPQMSCFDCDGCELAAAGGCGGLADAEAFTKINASMANSNVSQESILRLLG